MANDEPACYIYIQLPGTMETVPCATLKVRALGAGTFEGTLTYGKRYLERPEVVALDPFHRMATSAAVAGLTPMNFGAGPSRE